MSRLSKWFEEKGKSLMALFIAAVAIISTSPPEGMPPRIVEAQPAAPPANNLPNVVEREYINRDDLPDAAEAVKVLTAEEKEINFHDTAGMAEEGGDGNGKKEI
jgi:hypothetical protein